MSNIFQKSLILAVATGLTVASAGCQEQNLSNAKMHRLIANENRHLKDQLERCLHDKNALNEQMQKQVQELSDGAMRDFDEIVELREENKRLKTKVTSLEAQLSRLKKATPAIE